jgi:hypothetical protein
VTSAPLSGRFAIRIPHRQRTLFLNSFWDGRLGQLAFECLLLHEGEIMKLKILINLTIAVALGWQTKAQNYDTNGDYVQTFAGSGFSGYVDGVGQLTMFSGPSAIVADSHSNLFVWDANNSRIRKIAPDSTVSTFAGGGTQSTGIGTNVSFLYLSSNTQMTIDRNNTIWMVGENFGNEYVELYKITSDGTTTSTNLWGIGFNLTDGICADSSGNIYISGNNQIYRYNTTNGTMTVFAGSGNSGYADGNGIFTAFNSPQALAADAANDVYVSDWGNGLIRKIDQSQNVTTFAKSGSVYQICFDDSGNLIFACGNYIGKISATTNVVTMAGSLTQSGYTNGAGNVALFYYAVGVCFSQGMVFVADQGNNRIRQISFNPSSQVVSPANLQLNTYPGLQINGTVGRTYEIQTSPDLDTWTTKTTLLLNSNPYLWIDQSPVSGNKFYRAVMLP